MESEGIIGKLDNLVIDRFSHFQPMKSDCNVGVMWENLEVRQIVRAGQFWIDCKRSS